MSVIFDGIALYSQISIRTIHTIFDVILPGDFIFEGERHNFWEMDYTVEGSSVNTSDEKVYVCNEGDLIVQKPNAFHTSKVLNGKPTHIFMISFSGEGFASFMPSGKIRLDAELKKVFELMRDESKRAYPEGLSYLNAKLKEPQLSGNPAGAQALKNLLELFCLYIQRKGDKILEPPLENLRARKYAQISEYLRQNLDGNLTINQIARGVAESESNIKSIFKQYTNGGIMKYYNALRGEHCIRLINDGYSMSEISDTMGFSSQAYFSYFFKEMFGVPPSLYRK